MTTAKAVGGGEDGATSDIREGTREMNFGIFFIYKMSFNLDY